MREIKFRAWDKNGKGFINGFNMIGYSTGQGAPTKKLKRFSDSWNEEDIELMQFTGKRDSKRTDKFPKGQEVYESDIIECEYYSGEVWRGVVRWGFGEPSFFVLRDNDSCKCYSVNFSGSAVKRWEVIGNIHQNPELLLEGCE